MATLSGATSSRGGTDAQAPERRPRGCADADRVEAAADLLELGADGVGQLDLLSERHVGSQRRQAVAGLRHFPDHAVGEQGDDLDRQRVQPREVGGLPRSHFDLHGEPTAAGETGAAAGFGERPGPGGPVFEIVGNRSLRADENDRPVTGLHLQPVVLPAVDDHQLELVVQGVVLPVIVGRACLDADSDVGVRVRVLHRFQVLVETPPADA